MGGRGLGSGGGNSVKSNRYVLNQAYTIRNISGAVISGLQVFQLMHGLTSQRGVFDNRVYPWLAEHVSARCHTCLD